MEFRKGTTNTYTYDASGRVTADFNKNINKIEYNYLNLPQRIEFQNGNRIEYAYDTSGVKCRTKHYTAAGGTTITTEYVENKVYINGTLDKIQIEGGYIAKEGTTYNRYYYVKDHQGNNRVVLNMAGGIVHATNYYPFGLSFAEVPARVGQQVQSFKFNGKELDRMFGVDTYDYSARMYSPAIGRFMTMDPMAEKYYSISPYAYCLNNPLRYVDPKGKDVWDFIGGIIHSVGSNLSLGTVPTNTSFVSDAGDYNGGRTVGDVISVVMGAAETIVGGGEAAAGGSAVTVGTAGVGSPVTVPVAAAGVGMVVHGTGVMGIAIKSLVNQEGRVSQSSASKGSEKSNTSSGNKNSPHANQKAKDSAGQKYQEAKSQYDNLNSKPNKTPEDKKQLKKLENQVEHWKQKQDFPRKNHSKNAKGNR